jgi:hypothetical protein
VKGLTELELETIKQGQVVKGMSKNSVLISLGYPPKHMTPNLDSHLWKYWRNRFKSFNVEFDDSGLVKYNIDQPL